MYWLCGKKNLWLVCSDCRAYNTSIVCIVCMVILTIDILAIPMGEGELLVDDVLYSDN